MRVGLLHDMSTTDLPDERLYPVHKTAEEYAQNTVRKIELLLDKDEYREVIRLLRLIRRREGIATNTEAVCFVLRAYERNRHTTP